MRPPDIKALAENWYKPQLEERPAAFHQAVQRKLGEFSARGTLGSPFVYYAVETLAQQEVEQYGQIFFAVTSKHSPQFLLRSVRGCSHK